MRKIPVKLNYFVRTDNDIKEDSLDVELFEDYNIELAEFYKSRGCVYKVYKNPNPFMYIGKNVVMLHLARAPVRINLGEDGKEIVVSVDHPITLKNSEFSFEKYSSSHLM